MMYPYPYGMYRPYYSYYNRYKAPPPSSTEERVSKDIPKDIKQEEKPKEDRCEEKPVFEFGNLRLFSDDLLILAILFFLYSEGVKDPELFIALVLLLIS